MIDHGYIIQQIIKPPKFRYSISALGPPTFMLGNRVYSRTDFTVTTKDSVDLECSLFSPKAAAPRNLVIYLHCNTGSRIEGMQFVHQALQMDFAFLCYDSRGCGLSGGSYVTLGLKECHDLAAIVRRVEAEYIMDPYLVLWGRSMGAVTSIKYASLQLGRVVLTILDSPFLSLREIIQESGREKFGIPSFMTDLLIKYVDAELQERAGFTTDQLELKEHISRINCPLILMASKRDGLIPLPQFLTIYDLHPGKKTIFYLQEAHTDTRSDDTVSKVFQAITKYFSVSKNSKLSNLQMRRSASCTRGLSSGKKLSLTARESCRSQRSLSSKKRQSILTLKLLDGHGSLLATEKSGKQNTHHQLRGKVNELLMSGKPSVRILQLKKYQQRISSDRVRQ